MQYYKTNSVEIYKCDNLELLKNIPDNYINLIYCDILYNTGRKFKDYDDNLGTPQEAILWYEPRLLEMKRVLKDSGSIYLHMDFRLVHYMRVKMDEIFGYQNFQNEIIWVYRSQGFSKNKWSSKHDNILFYSKGKNFTFNLEDVREEEIGEETKKRFGKEIEEKGYYEGVKNGKTYQYNPYSPPRDWMNINTIPHASPTRNGYETQKPIKLIERIIKASSNSGDIVLDCFMGSGTTAEASVKLKRRFIGCDISEKACSLTKERLIKYE